MPRKPLVGLNADYRPTRKEGPALSYLAAGYYNAIQAAGVEELNIAATTAPQTISKLESNTRESVMTSSV